MSDDALASRPFDEDEIGAILKRAAELESQGADEQAFGLSRAELSRIAEEVGIDPRNVDAAIAELALSPAEAPPNWWGGPLSLTLDRVIPGALSEATWEAMLAEIRRTFREIGREVQRGPSREWSRSQNRADVQQAYVTATSEEGRTRLQVVWNEPIAAVPIYVISGALSLILMPIIFGSLGMVSFTGLGLFLTLVATLYMLARWLVLQSSRKKKREVRALMGRLERILAEPERYRAEEQQDDVVGVSAPSEGRLRVDLEGGEEGSREEATRQVRRRQRSG